MSDTDVRSFCRDLVLLAAVRANLINGVRHYDLDGNLLASEVAILAEMRRPSVVGMDERDQVERTTVREQLMLELRARDRAIAESN